MTVEIERHWTAGPNAERFATALESAATAAVDALEENPGSVDLAFSRVYQYMQARCTTDPAVDLHETWEAVVTTMQVATAMFAVTGRDSGVVECRINHKVRELAAIGPRRFADAGNWITAFWLTVVCRDQQRMTDLCRIPIEALRSPEGQYDEYVYEWIDVLQTYWLDRPGLANKMIAVLESSDPSVATIVPRDLLQFVLYQPIGLFRRFVRNDRAGFNPALAQALELHKRYWTEDEERAKDPDGRIALGPLAITCFAYDADFPIEVDSGYLPINLVRRSWLGEFEI